MAQELPVGWLSEIEAACLAELATDQLVLEVGAYAGRSTVAMARTAHHVLSLDHHRGSREHQAGEQYHDPQFVDPDTDVFTTFPAFALALERHGVAHKVSILLADCAIGLHLLERIFTFAFIDAGHDFSMVKRDAALVQFLVEPEGAIAFHDFGIYPGVTTAVIDFADGRKIEMPAESLAVIRL